MIITTTTIITTTITIITTTTTITTTIMIITTTIMIITTTTITTTIIITTTTIITTTITIITTTTNITTTIMIITTTIAIITTTTTITTTIMIITTTITIITTTTNITTTIMIITTTIMIITTTITIITTTTNITTTIMIITTTIMIIITTTTIMIITTTTITTTIITIISSSINCMPYDQYKFCTKCVVFTSAVRANFICNDPIGFCWWLVSQVASLYWFSERGIYSVRKKGSTAGNWVFVVDLLKSSLSNVKSGGHEEMHRRFYLKCCIAVSRHWSANTSLVLWLWDYFHKRMNDVFHIPSSTLHGLTTVSITAAQWMEQCLDRCQDVQTSLDQENSYSLFLRIIAIHLNKLLHTGSQQGWKQMKGRFYSKFHKRRMEELNETGLNHFLGLFLTLSYAAELEDVAAKMCQFLDLLDFTSEHPGKKVAIIKAVMMMVVMMVVVVMMMVVMVVVVVMMMVVMMVVVVMMMMVVVVVIMMVVMVVVMAMMMVVVVMVMMMVVVVMVMVGVVVMMVVVVVMVVVVMVGVVVVVVVAMVVVMMVMIVVMVLVIVVVVMIELVLVVMFMFAVCVLLSASEGFKWLFTGCHDNELHHVLTFVQSMLAVARPSQGDRMNNNDNIQDVSGFLWEYMFPHLQKLSRDRTVMSTNLADTMAGFTLLALERYSVPVDEAARVSFVDLVHEYGVEDDIPASFSCRFLCQVIAARGAVSVLQTESLQGHVIHTWFRCLLQLPPSHENCAEFTRAVAKLPVMELLTKNQSGFGLSDNSENTLKQFIISVGTYNATLTKFDEMIQFRERAQTYFGDVGKYIDTFVSSGKPQDSLRLAFSVCGSLFKYAYKNIYSKTQPHCLLPRLLDQLIVPLHSNKKTVPPIVQQCLKAYLHLIEHSHLFLQGLSCLDFRRDDFIKRKIRQIFGKYFHPLCQVSAITCTMTQHQQRLHLTATPATTTPYSNTSNEYTLQQHQQRLHLTATPAQWNANHRKMQGDHHHYQYTTFIVIIITIVTTDITTFIIIIITIVTTDITTFIIIIITIVTTDITTIIIIITIVTTDITTFIIIIITIATTAITTFIIIIITIATTAITTLIIIIITIVTTDITTFTIVIITIVTTDFTTFIIIIITIVTTDITTLVIIIITIVTTDIATFIIIIITIVTTAITTFIVIIDFRQFVVEIVSDSFLQLPQPPQNLTSVSQYICLFQRECKDIFDVYCRNTTCMLIPALGCLLACNASPPANEPPNIRRQATDLLRMMIESCKEDQNHRDILLPLLRSFVFNNLQQFQGLVFKTFDPLAVLDPDLVAEIIPVLKHTTMDVANFLFPKIVVLILLQLLIAVISADNGDPSTWPGHLEPLGARSHKTSPETVDQFPSPRDFFTKYVSPLQPLFVKGGAKISPGFQRWTDQYFMSLADSKNHTIFAEQGKKENRTNPGKDISFHDFVKTYKEEDIYMVNGVLPFLQKDILLPPSLLCEEITNNMLVDTVMWFSSGGTKSVLHNDDVDNINCLFSGTKELLFIDYKKYNDKVTLDHRSGGYSGVDVDKVDFTKYPGLREVTYYNVTMQAGDCLYIPYKWFHQVRSYDRNIAVNVWFKHKADFVPSNCDLAKSKEPQTLDKFLFSALALEGQDEEEATGPLDLIDYFSGFLKAKDDHKMTLETFIDHMKNDNVLMNKGKYKWNDKFNQVAQSMFGAVDINKDGVFDGSDQESFEAEHDLTDKLENFAAEIEDLIEDQNEPTFQKKEEEKEEEKRDEL
ncbi:hypothetical protein QZH41_019916 [Actinostola sp. cb2023]|nr:hypothetical protein QZH41_019916 [Actinostola sp. cb2023]